MARTILIAGATGLVGGKVLELALQDPRVDRVIAVLRRPLAEHPKLEQWVGPDLLKSLKEKRPDAVICCLGTTINKENGNKEAFKHVDQELVLGLGRWASGPAMRFCLISSLGANARSMFFYNQVKGTVEDALRGMDFEALHLFQPSILDGPRSEVRTGERIGLVLMRAIAPLLPAKYRPMRYDVLAKALINAALGKDKGTQVRTYQKIVELASQ